MIEAQLYLGDCLEFMKTLDPGRIDAVITDPPYGANKAIWDYYFPKDWYTFASQISEMVIIITGSSGLKDTIPLVGEKFIDVIAARNLNGMTRGPIGFNNWLAAVISGRKPEIINSWNYFEFVIDGNMPDHPSPKPMDYMKKLIERTTKQGDLIFDPFMGSGTTGVAAIQTGRNFIGCEIDPGYFAIAKKRIEIAQMQPRLEGI